MHSQLHQREAGMGRRAGVVVSSKEGVYYQKMMESKDGTKRSKKYSYLMTDLYVYVYETREGLYG